MTNSPKLKLLIWCLALILILGSANEVHHFSAQTDKVAVVLMASPIKKTEFAEPKKTEGKDEFKAEPKVELKRDAEPTVNQKVKPQVLTEFLDYIRETDKKLKEVENRPENVLEKIHQPKKEVKSEPNYFEEGTIEIYDSKKGVVDVIEEPAEKETVKAEPKVKKEVTAEVKPIEKAEPEVKVKSEPKAAEKVAADAKPIEKAEPEVRGKSEPKAAEKVTADAKPQEKAEPKNILPQPLKNDTVAVKSETQPASDNTLKAEPKSVVEDQVKTKNEIKADAKPTVKGVVKASSKAESKAEVKHDEKSADEEEKLARQQLDKALTEMFAGESDVNPEVKNKPIENKEKNVLPVDAEQQNSGAINLMEKIISKK